VGARLDKLGVAWERSPWLDDVLVVHRLQSVLQSGLAREGLVAVQDEAAAMVVRVLDPQPDDAILDAAAAPGGKALYAAERMQNRGRVIAVDVHAGKLRLLSKAAAEHGLSTVATIAADLRVPGAVLAGGSDRVLLDAPCSGTGVLGRRADLRWHREETDIEVLTHLQDELLDAAAAAVRPGGLLVYATCSIEPEENQQRVEAFITRHSDFSRENVGALVPEAMRTSEGDYATLPHIHATDGAFAARLRRDG
jgi:16S rRNA (cytosine967-C5)-methyltransferase